MKALHIDAPLYSEPTEWQTANKKYLMIQKGTEKKKKKKVKRLKKQGRK